MPEGTTSVVHKDTPLYYYALRKPRPAKHDLSSGILQWHDATLAFVARIVVWSQPAWSMGQQAT